MPECAICTPGICRLMKSGRSFRRKRVMFAKTTRPTWATSPRLEGLTSYPIVPSPESETDSAKGASTVAHSRCDHRPGRVLDPRLARPLCRYSHLARRESAPVPGDH